MRLHRVSPTGELARRLRAAALVTTTAVALAAWAPDARAEIGDEQERLASGPYAVLQAVLKKTLLQLEVVRLQIRVDANTQRKLAAIASGRKQSNARADGVVRAVMDTRLAIITAELRRDVPFDKYAQSAYVDLGSARESGLISENVYWSLARLLPEWFRALQDRGARKGDRFMCHLRPGSMRVVYRTRDSVTLVDRTIQGEGPGRAVLASYLAPDSSFRKLLITSLFR